MLPTMKSRLLRLLLTSMPALMACSERLPRTDDYLSPALRTAVEQLKTDVASDPTNATTIAERARVLAEWADAYALAGHDVGLEGPRVRLQATRPPEGQVALRQSAVVDRLVREFSLRDEEGALGELTAESLGPFEARSYATIRQTWTVGTHPVEVGGGFWVARHFGANFGVFQTGAPSADGYLTVVTTDSDAELVVDGIMASGPHGGFRAPPHAAIPARSGSLSRTCSPARRS